MFSLQWNIENLIAPIICGTISGIMVWFFAQSVGYKKTTFLWMFVDNSVEREEKYY